MSAERERRLAVRWGLIALGALGLFVVRLLRSFLELLGDFRKQASPSVLANRMSQLKPPMWKAPWLGLYAYALAALLAGVVLFFLIVGVRDALRGADDRG